MSGLNFHPIKLLEEPMSRIQCGQEQYIDLKPARVGRFCDYGLLSADQLVDGDMIGRSCEFSRAALRALDGSDPVFHSGRSGANGIENPLIDYLTPHDLEHADSRRRSACLLGVDPVIEQAAAVPRIFESEAAISDGFWTTERDQFWSW